MIAFLQRPCRFVPLAVAVLGVTLCTQRASAQSAAPATSFRVLITTPDGERPISKDRLTAFLDTQPAEVQDLTSAKDQPLVFAILLDVSKSGEKKQSFEIDSALELFRAVAVAPNTAFFGDFNDELWLTQKPASIDDVAQELKQMGRFRGGTALYDSLLVAARRVNEAAKDTNSRRAVFVFTDGNDNASKLGLRQLVPALQREGVPVFCIGLLEKPSREKAIPVLKTISESTGGVAHLLKDKTQVVPSLLAELANQYWLTLAAPAAADGRMHGLLVKSENRTVIAVPTAVMARPSADPLQEARQSLTGDHKDTEKARKLLLEVVQSGSGASPETLAWAHIYLGYIEDRANNRQSAIGWYEKALNVAGAPPGSVNMAKFGLRQPLVWIRHLDSAGK